MMVVELYILYYYASPFFVFFFLKNFEKYLNDMMLCTKGHVCDIEHIIYISYVRMHMATLQYLLQEIFMLMSSCISTIERIFLMNFSIRNYSSCPIIGKSHNILCFMFMSMGDSTFIFICSHFRQLALYKSSLTGAFFMCVETRTFALSLVLLFSTFGAVFTEFGACGFR